MPLGREAVAFCSARRYSNPIAMGLVRGKMPKEVVRTHVVVPQGVGGVRGREAAPHQALARR